MLPNFVQECFLRSFGTKEGEMLPKLMSRSSILWVWTWKSWESAAHFSLRISSKHSSLHSFFQRRTFSRHSIFKVLATIGYRWLWCRFGWNNVARNGQHSLRFCEYGITADNSSPLLKNGLHFALSLFQNSQHGTAWQYSWTKSATLWILVYKSCGNAVHFSPSSF